MKKYKFISLFFVFLFIVKTAFAGLYSQRRCMLLPITDSVDGVLGFKVYEEIERYLKDSSWCYYKSNSEIINILQNYRKGLSEFLKNKEVVRNISEKVQAGSLIKVDLKSQVKGIDVEVLVLSDDGNDVYFREKTHVDSDDPVILGQTVSNWLNLYEKNIPYDGQVIGVLGDQFTLDVGRASLVRVGEGVKVVTPIRKKKHPLLKEVVEWETDLVARAKIFNVSEFQARAKVTTYHGQRKIQAGDWVRIDKSASAPKTDQVRYPDFDKENFGKLGLIAITLETGKGSVNTVVNGSRKVGGFQIGFHVLGEIWATRNFWASMELGRRFATYKKKQGTTVQDSNNITAGVFKFKLGYKYLPLGFFYGPQIDGYVGFAKFSYNMDTQVNDGFSDSSLKGMLIGVRGDVPVHKLFRVYARLELMPKPGYREKTLVLGNDESALSLQFELGTHYLYSSNITIDAGFQLTSNKAKFSSAREITYKDNLLRVGASFNF